MWGPGVECNKFPAHVVMIATINGMAEETLEGEDEKNPKEATAMILRSHAHPALHLTQDVVLFFRREISETVSTPTVSQDVHEVQPGPDLLLIGVEGRIGELSIDEVDDVCFCCPGLSIGGNEPSASSFHGLPLRRIKELFRRLGFEIYGAASGRRDASARATCP